MTTPIGQLDGIMTIFCIVGPKAPGSHDQESGEGATLVLSFNHTVHGENIYIQTS